MNIMSQAVFPIFRTISFGYFAILIPIPSSSFYLLEYRTFAVFYKSSLYS